jgi:hypothetical protein
MNLHEMISILPGSSLHMLVSVIAMRTSQSELTSRATSSKGLIKEFPTGDHRREQLRLPQAEVSLEKRVGVVLFPQRLQALPV